MVSLLLILASTGSFFLQQYCDVCMMLIFYFSLSFYIHKLEFYCKEELYLYYLPLFIQAVRTQGYSVGYNSITVILFLSLFLDW